MPVLNYEEVAFGLAPDSPGTKTASE